ncbi:alpha-1,2-mannosyltransferase [Hamadaea flava]|uniref:Glycosyltransferase 87 family protein n=1 Tax=Hamadaea flava TaxID=1742688 RepID=A0ABV8M2C2_9ACTN|nr:glycosyltransferase 87 family protein [Hamadaea flava]MCP2326914.1 alpha-1,2-mannosyltransferase [Hamadaea flava]
MPEPARNRRLAIVAVTWVVAAVAFWWLFRGQHFFDLKIYISAEKWWLDGHELYDFAQPDDLQGRLYFTYPPFAALIMAPLGLLPQGLGIGLLTAGTIAAVVVTTWWVTGGLAHRLAIPHWYAFGLATPLVFVIEPIRTTLSFGQINMYLVALILLDLLVLLPRGSRFTGVGIGLAAAIKLTPALFIIYLLVTRRIKEAFVAAGTAIGVTLLAALIAPTATRDFWFGALWDTSRVGRTDYTANQSLNGLLSRLAAPDRPDQALWAGLAVAVAVYGLWRASIAARGGDEITGLALTGLTAGLISPITWVHHMYWFVPAIVALVGAAYAARGNRRGWLLPAAVAAYAICVIGVDTFVDWGVEQRPTPGVREFLLRNAFVLLSLALVLLLPVPTRRPAPEPLENGPIVRSGTQG